MPEAVRSCGAFDYIVVGAGSAGCLLAARLSEDPEIAVLLIEAGTKSDGLMVRMPAGSFKLMGNRAVDWCYSVEPDESRAGRRQLWSAGRMMGGSSAINGMVYIRGQKSDYDGWAADGCPGWSAAEIWPYFNKFERRRDDAESKLGGLVVSPSRTIHPVANAFVEACGQIGLRRRDYYGEGDLDGAFLSLSTIDKGKRCSAENAFLHPVRYRKNLTVLTGRHVERIDFEGRRATGVTVRHSGVCESYVARGEVLVSAGAIGSPILLQRSGIGPAADLSPLGIEVVADLPVGNNLHEHASVQVSKLVNHPTYNSPLGPIRMARYLAEYLAQKRGPMTSPAVQAMAFGKSAPELRVPDICISFLPLALNFKTAPPKLHDQPGITLAGKICQPFSRGRVMIRDREPETPPRIDYRMLEDERDVAGLIATGRLCEAIFAAPALSKFVVGANLPAAPLKTDDEWRDYLRDWLGIGFHPVGSCRMGEAGKGVVDPALKVHGIEGLRVVDASIMPRITSGNTNAPTFMIAEKAAAMILQSRK